MTILSKNDQKGRSMVEMLGVLAIIGVLSVGGISGYSKAMGKFKMTKAQDQMSMILMNVRTAFATSPSYEGLNNKNALDYGIVPSEMYTAGMEEGDLVNAFGGAAYIFSCSDADISESGASSIGGCSEKVPTDAGSPEMYFSISMSGLSKEECVALGSVDWGSDGLIGVTIGEKSLGPEDFPPTLANIAAGCDADKTANDKTSGNTITWTYF